VLFISHTSCQAPILDPPQPPPSIGYVRIRTYPGAAPSVTAYVREIQDLMASFDGDDVVGWIVDVRGNQGADQWPMLAAVGPILGEGVAGYSVDGDGVAHPWEYRDGASWLGGTEMHRVADPYRLVRERPPVAVIVDNRTTAAGEAVVVAFRGRADARSFGQETCGLSTMTRAFTMSDGAVLNLTTAVMADRTGATYGAMIVPDEPGLGPFQAFDRAIEWLSEPRP
jgi:carboxyl-terminal processing protease